MNWKNISIVCGAILSLAAVFTLVYKADSWNLRNQGKDIFVMNDKLAEAGEKYFPTIDTYLAGQKKVEKKFDQWDLKDKLREIAEMDQKYGDDCETCDPKLKSYYDWLLIERDKLINSIQDG